MLFNATGDNFNHVPLEIPQLSPDVLHAQNLFHIMPFPSPPFWMMK